LLVLDIFKFLNNYILLVISTFLEHSYTHHTKYNFAFEKYKKLHDSTLRKVFNKDQKVPLSIFYYFWDLRAQKIHAKNSSFRTEKIVSVRKTPRQTEVMFLSVFLTKIIFRITMF